jgi:hypothetical protein
VEEAEMTNSNLPNDPTWQAYGALQDRVQAIRDQVSACKIDMMRMGQNFPYRTFPEEGMANIAEQFDRLAADTRSMIENAAKARHEVAA